MFDIAVPAVEVILQNGVDVDVDLDGPSSLLGGAVGSFATTLVVGAILFALVPEYTDWLIGTVLRDPLTSFLYGFLALLLLIVAIVVLVVTVIGILIVIPLALLAYLGWAVGATVALLAIAERLVGREDGWMKPLLVAAAINGVLALTGIGGLVSFAIGAVGFGAVLRDGFA
jgi:hypothetical protein